MAARRPILLPVELESGLIAMIKLTVQASDRCGPRRGSHDGCRVERRAVASCGIDVFCHLKRLRLWMATGSNFTGWRHFKRVLTRHDQLKSCLCCRQTRIVPVALFSGWTQQYKVEFTRSPSQIATASNSICFSTRTRWTCFQLHRTMPRRDLVRIVLVGDGERDASTL